jgi:hypothetical protein
MTADVSQDNSVLFVGGSTEYEFDAGVAILQAVSFTSSLGFITDLRLDERDNRYVSKIKRIEETDRFFAATIGAIYVYEFKNSKFAKLAVIQNLGTQPDNITDLVMIKNALYSFVAGGTEINRIEFASY